MRKLIVALPVAAGLLTGVAETEVSVAGKPAHRIEKGVVGVNQLAYGKDGCGFLLPGKKDVQPELVEMLKEIGIRSMRYPGGCGGTHMYDWKKSCGLNGWVEGLGLVQFLEVCEKTGAEPMLGLSAFRGSPGEAAQFVEFLNAPDDGKHFWASERARLGHPKPYGVKYVEYGNETYHGNHYAKPQGRVTPEEYAWNYLATRWAMQQIDPNIRLGLCLRCAKDGFWDKAILDIVGDRFDYVIYHSYAGPDKYNTYEYMRNFSRQADLAKVTARAKDRFASGHAPRIAVTEFNSNYAQHRHLTSALINTEALMHFASEPAIFQAHYWQFVNEGFGMVRGKTGEFVKRPNALAFELFSKTLRDRWVPLEIKGRMSPVDPEAKELPADQVGKNWLNPKANWRFVWGNPGAKATRLGDGEWRVDLEKDDIMNFYHFGTQIGGIPEGDEFNWRLTAELKTIGREHSQGMSLQFGDARGWDKTRSCSSCETVNYDDWTPVESLYKPLKDTKGLEIRFRTGGGGRGSLLIRNVKVFREARSKVTDKVVSGMLSVAEDGRSGGLILVNRSFDPEPVSFDASKLGSLGFAQATSLTGPDAYATNEEKADNVKLVPTEVKTSGNRLKLILPPHSVTGVDLKL